MLHRLLFALLLGVPSLLAVPTGKATLKPTRTTVPPVLDGRLDDPVWAQAQSVTDFETFIPEFGKKQAGKTSLAWVSISRSSASVRQGA